MKPSAVWKRAARNIFNGKCPCGCGDRVDDGHFSLCMVVSVNFSNKENTQEQNRLWLFKPNREIYGYWWPLGENQNERILAALFLSAMADSEGK